MQVSGNLREHNAFIPSCPLAPIPWTVHRHCSPDHAFIFLTAHDPLSVLLITLAWHAWPRVVTEPQVPFLRVFGLGDPAYYRHHA